MDQDHPERRVEDLLRAVDRNEISAPQFTDRLQDFSERELRLLGNRLLKRLKAQSAKSETA